MTTRTRHSPKQIVDKLDAADELLAAGLSIAMVCNKLGVSKATYHRWRKRFDGLPVDLAEWLTDLECDNATLRRRLNDCELEVVALQTIVGSSFVSPELRRASVRYLQETLGISERFACRVTGQHRSTQRRPS